MIKSVAALKLFASSMQDEDILRSLYVLSFNDIPNKDFSIKEAITRRADAKEKLNLVERQLIAKEVCTVLKNASALFDSELANITNNANNFIQPKNPEFIKSAKFGLLANVNGKYHLVNPLTNRVASEFIIEAADERYAKLHELVGQYRKENKISYFDESDGMMVLTGSPEVINDLEHKVKDIGYYCEAVNEETGAEGEIPEYSLKVFIDKVTSLSTTAEQDKSLPITHGYEKLFTDKNVKVEVRVDESSDKNGVIGEYAFFNPENNDLIASQEIIKNKDSFALGEIKFFDGVYSKPLPSTLENNEPTYSKFDIGEDVWSEALLAINDDFDKRNSGVNQEQDLEGIKVEKVDATNPNIEKDNPMLKHEGVTDEVVEKTSAEKPVEKKAEEKIDFEKELMEAGKSKGEKDKVNETQLAMGKEVEKEHTSNQEIAEKITRDHLAEIPDYYTHLKEMEDNVKKNDTVKSYYAPFITVDSTEEGKVRVIAGDKVVSICKTVKAAFEKSAELSEEKILLDDGTGVLVTYSIYDVDSELPGVWAALRHPDKGNNIMCSDAVYVEDLLSDKDHIDFLKDIKGFSKEFAKVGLDEEKVQHYQDQTNAKLKEIFQPKPESEAVVDEDIDKESKVVKQDGKYQAQSEDGKNFGTYDTKQEAEDRVKQMEMFKHMDKKASDDQELKQFDMKQEKDGQKEFEQQDDSLKDVSIPEEKEDTSEVNEAMSAKPAQNKGESFSASEFGNNLAYIKQNNPEDFESIMANLKQLMVGDQKPMYDFLELWSQNNFQNFTETTRVDPTYERHSQYQEQLKNNVLPKVMEMSEYKKAMEEKVSAEKGA